MPYSKKQADVILNANARWNILCGAVRSGKTHISYDMIVRRLGELPDGDRVMIGRTQQTLERNVLNPLRRRLGNHFVSSVNSKNTAYIAGKPFYVVGADNKEAVTKIQGLGLIYAYGDEITTWHEDVFQMLKSRLSDKGALFDGTCNPASPTHWLKTDILDNPELNVYQKHFVIDDNPFLPPEYVAELKKEYSGVFYQRYILGRWVIAEGLIYPQFSRESHVVPSEPRQYSEYQVSIDYGTYNPFHALLWGFAKGVWYCIKEYRHTGRDGVQKDPTQYYAELEKLTGDLTISKLIIDPSADAFIALIRNRGKYSLRKANNEVLAGIECVSVCLNKGLIRVNDCCRHLIEEFGLYAWNEKSAEDEPIKDDDHGMDALRYFIFTNRLGWRAK